MATNKFSGRCQTCRTEVLPGAGTVTKVRGMWIVRCAVHSAQVIETPILEREMVGAIYWPNGMGYTECSEAYEIAHGAMLDAKDALESLDGDEGRSEYRAAYEAFHRASDAFARLQADGGHLGERVTFDKPDMMSALLGGGRIAVAPGGAAKIVTA